MKENILVKIRFNTNYKPNDGSKEWRVLVNGYENFCNHVTIKCASKTTKDYIEGVGDKWHITCEASDVEYIKDEELLTKNVNLYKEIILH
ncbi:MAG TPA: hypothetical protein VN721_15045 [Flavipsychrobacter sp.]|nr:hypothetical protein [Flavipsychrobacter sp.]